MVMSGAAPPMVAALRRVRGCTVWNASVEMLRRTRWNAATIGGAAPEVTIGAAEADQAGARPYHCRGIAA
jgi:hypothetical protein